MKRVEQKRGIVKDTYYNILFNYDVDISTKNFRGEDILQLLRDDNDISIFSDERLGALCLWLETELSNEVDVITAYISFLSEWVNRHPRELTEHITLNAMRHLGFVLAFAAPSILSDRVTVYEQTLLRNNITITKAKAFTPISPYPLHYIDLWVPKMEVAEILGISPSTVRSHHVAKFLADEIKRGD